MTDTPILPPQFAELAPLAAKWGRATENARSHIRWNANKADFAAFYESFMPHLDAVLDYLAGFKPGEMPEDAHNLFELACAFAEASPHHELYAGSPAVPFSFDAARFVPTHGDTAV